MRQFVRSYSVRGTCLDNERSEVVTWNRQGLDTYERHYDRKPAITLERRELPRCVYVRGRE